VASPLKMISAPIRDLLIEHIDGPVTLSAPADETFGAQITHRNRRQNIMNALNAGLIEQIAPTQTAMTEKGREALCKMLGHWADVLSRAGFEFTAAPIMKDPLAAALIDSGSRRK